MRKSFLSFVLAIGLITTCTVTNASYLERPRIHFAGHYRADAVTTNNMACNFDVNLPYDPVQNKDWNSMGTNEFSFIDTTVYGAVSMDGDAEPHDTVLNAKVFDNGESPFGKIVIQDVDTENTTALYGVRFGIGWEEDETGEVDYAFYGTWSPNIIAQMLWHKLKCYNESLLQDTFPRGAMATTKLTGVQWKEGELNSEVLKELRVESQANGNTLQVSVTFYFYTRRYQDFVKYNFTLGYVVGTVGVYKEGEPLNYGGDRILTPYNGGKAPKSLQYTDPHDTCNRNGEITDLNVFKPWMYKAPFILNPQNDHLTVDMSNALPITSHSNLRDIGRIYLGRLICSEGITSEQLRQDCKDVELLHEILYLENDWLYRTGGVVDIPLNSAQYSALNTANDLVVIIEDETGELMCTNAELFWSSGVKTPSEPGYILGLEDEDSANTESVWSNKEESSSLATCQQDQRFQLMLSEEELYVRLLGFYNARIEKGQNFEFELYVTKYGKPIDGVTTVISEYRQENLIPQHGVIVTGDQPSQKNSNNVLFTKSITDENGIAKFTFSVAVKMNATRKYQTSPCPDLKKGPMELPIDGQSYQFKYGICLSNECKENEIDTSGEDVTPISVRAFSTANVTKFQWDRDIHPIFRQYSHLYPVMSTILNLDNYTDVTKYQNLKLLYHSMSLDINDPNFMPATRDLAPSKQKLIVEWLQDLLKHPPSTSKYPSDPLNTSDRPPTSPELVDVPVCKSTDTATVREYHSIDSVCIHTAIPIDERKVCDFMDDYYTVDIFQYPEGEEDCTRPLYGYEKGSSNDKAQLLKNVQDQLKLAVQLEFATIPIYLTALYSLEPSCNPEIYSVTHSVVMQEMLHMIQSANILLAIGGQIDIDSEDFVPSFPGRGLPGCCHPNLEIYLDQFSPNYFSKLFVAIEQPELTCVARKTPKIANNTIGQFYREINQSLFDLGDHKFVKNTSNQVSWPWKILPDSPLGQLVVPVTDVASAAKGIKLIVDQGEGANAIDPEDLDYNKQLAHYYKFQEVVCGRQLEMGPDHIHYAYNGNEIKYLANGVYNMRKNPGSQSIEPGTNCYTEAKAFHSVFRGLLKELNDTFNGDPNNILKTVELMESLQVHFKRVMRVKYDSDEEDGTVTTCGPVWDYIWKDKHE